MDDATEEKLIAKYRSDPNVNDFQHLESRPRHGAMPMHTVVPADQLGTYEVLDRQSCHRAPPGSNRVFIASAQKLLHPERGMLALAVPDKRWCFDYLKQQVSSTGHFSPPIVWARNVTVRQPAFTIRPIFAFDNGCGGLGTASISTGLQASLYVEIALTSTRIMDGRSGCPVRGLSCLAFHAFEFCTANSRSCRCRPYRLARRLASAETWSRISCSPRARPGAFRHAGSSRRPAPRTAETDFCLRFGSRPIGYRSAATAEPAPPVVIDGGFDAEARQNLQQIAETAAAIRTVLRPGQAIWQQMMPLRRKVAKLRGGSDPTAG